MTPEELLPDDKVMDIVRMAMSIIKRKRPKLHFDEDTVQAMALYVVKYRARLDVAYPNSRAVNFCITAAIGGYKDHVKSVAGIRVVPTVCLSEPETIATNFGNPATKDEPEPYITEARYRILAIKHLYYKRLKRKSRKYIRLARETLQELKLAGWKYKCKVARDERRDQTLHETE